MFIITTNSCMSTVGEERESFQNVLQLYIPLIDHYITVATTNLKLWKIKCSRLNLVSKSSINALSLCDKHIFPNI